MTLEYTDISEWRRVELPWQRRGLMYTASGYGSRIPTEWTVRLPGKGARWYRVYCRIYSNSGTCYVKSQGRELIVRDEPPAAVAV